MLDCISVSNMRDSDAYTIENFVPSLELMHRAAMGVFLAHDWTGRIAIVVGSGNNGGDGFALACILQERGFYSVVFTLTERYSPDSTHYAEKAEGLGVPIRPFAPGSLTGFDTVVDCLLGTGFQGALRPDYRAAIDAINESGAFVLSVDINSGMNGDTGRRGDRPLGPDRHHRLSQARTGDGACREIHETSGPHGHRHPAPASGTGPDSGCIPCLAGSGDH